MFRHVSRSGQTLGNISEKHRETSNVSEFVRKHFCFPGRKSCFRNNVSTGGQTWKHLRKHRELQMFPQQCFLVCPGLKKVRKLNADIIDLSLYLCFYLGLCKKWSVHRHVCIVFSPEQPIAKFSFNHCVILCLQIT